MGIISGESDCIAFDMRRVVGLGGRVNIAPKVRSVSLSRVDPSRLRLVRWSNDNEMSVSSRHCAVHPSCLGHLRSNDGYRIALPSFLARLEDPLIMGEVDRLTLGLMQGVIDPLQYAINLRNHISGKRGALKYGCMGFVPLTTMRGVASCYWSEKYDEVMIPRRWAKRVKVPARASDGCLVSPSYEWTYIREGDYAILSRCPVLSHESMRCVTIRFWDNPSIGVHPEYCVPLNLDYDGDEVHVSVVRGRACILEARRSMELNPLSKFSFESIHQSIPRSVRVRQQREQSSIDFMLLSTLSLSRDRDVISLSPLHGLSRCKEREWRSMCTSFSDRSSRLRSFVATSIRSIHDLTDSHIRVSEGFTVGRQLKHIMLQISSDETSILNAWAPRELTVAVDRTILDGWAPEPGFPGTMLSSTVSSRVQQALMDRAKHDQEIDRRELLLDLLWGDDSFYLIADSADRMIMSSSVSRIPSGFKCLFPMNRSSFSRVQDRDERYRRCFIAVSAGCMLSGIKASTRQIAEFAHCIFSSTFMDPIRSITGPNSVRFLSDTISPALMMAACDDIYVLDSRHSAAQDGSLDDTCDIRQPVFAIMSGNYLLHYSRSIGAF